MTVRAGRWKDPGRFVGSGFTPRDYLFHSSPARRALHALLPRTTPTRLRAGLAAVVVLCCCLAGAVAALSAGLEGDFQAVGQRAAPEVDATTDLYHSLNDMDAQVANVLLVGGDIALAADRSRDLATYASDRATADADLQSAAELPQPAGPVQPPGTTADSTAAQRELRSILDGIGQYEALAAEAIMTDRQAARTAGHAPAAALAYYRQAADLMRTGILPQVIALTTSNAANLDSAYRSGRSAADTGVAAALGTGIALVAALAALQFYLALRFRRMVNPALAAATLFALVMTGYAAGTFGGEAERLRAAKQDAFDSVLALSQASAVSYDVNADESRYLIDPGRAVGYQQAYLTGSQRLADVGRVSIGGYDAALAGDIPAARSGTDPRVLFGGYLGAEFRNITFPGERAAAIRALLAFQVYEKDDRRLRAIARSDVAKAVAFDIGTRPGQSDWAFSQYMAALSALIAINQNAFDADISAGERDALWDSGQPAAGAGAGLRASAAPVAALLLAGLVFLGVRPRLAEYRRPGSGSGRAAAAAGSGRSG